MKMEMKNPKNLISRVGLLFLAGSSLLAACSATDSGQNGVNWLFLAIAVIFVVVLIVGLVLLVRSGKFKQWGTAGLNANKWKLQERKITSQKGKIEEELAGLMVELGQKAWDAKVSDPSYSGAYDALVTLDQQRSDLVAAISALKDELNTVSGSRAKLVAEYENQMRELEATHKNVAKKFDKTTSEQEKLQKELDKLLKDREKLQAELDTQRNKLAELAESDDPDKDARIAASDEKIMSLEVDLAQVEARIAEIENQRSHLAIEQKPFEEKIARLQDQISTVEGNREEALAPLDQRIAALEENVQSKEAAITALKEEMAPMIGDLGPLVETARPESDALTDSYKKIDETKANLGEISQELYLIAARLETCDQGSVRNFYLMVAGIVLLVVLSVIFFIQAFV
jgi:chromosome segregation ATPase